MKWSIVADSSCDLFERDIACEDIGFTAIPFVMQIGDREYVDDEALDTGEMLVCMESCRTAPRTACPSPGRWCEAFVRAERSIAITISARLSGSHNSAMKGMELALEEHPEKDIAVLDSCSTGPETAMCIRKMKEWITAGHSMESVLRMAKLFLERTHTVFALCSFDNLVKNGRMSRIAGFVARSFGMWGIGVGTDEGEIRIKGKTRGVSGALKIILQDMRENGFTGGEVAISHCHNESAALSLRDAIKSVWEQSAVTVMPTRGLDSFYAERGGIIVGYIT